MIYPDFLAPIHNFTDLPFRLLCQRYGASSACVPLINAQAVLNNPKKLKKLIDAHPDERNIGIQIIGNDTEKIVRSAQAILKAYPFISYLNLNCGCPSQTTMCNGGGSAMLYEPKKIFLAVSGIKRDCTIPLSVKLRLLERHQDTDMVCRGIEEAGADFIILHGRTPGQGYGGESNWKEIKRIKSILTIPVVGNGDIKDMAAGRRYVESGYCDSFMVARAAMKNPMLFSGKEPSDFKDRMRLLEEYLTIFRSYIGEPRVNDARIKALQFFNAVPSATSIRDRVCRAKTIDEISSISEEE